MSSRESSSHSLSEKNYLISMKVENLSLGTTVKYLNTLFEKHGCSNITDIYLPKDPITQLCRGFAFVRFQDSRDGIRAIKTINGLVVDGDKIVARVARFGKFMDPAFKESSYPTLVSNRVSRFHRSASPKKGDHLIRKEFNQSGFQVASLVKPVPSGFSFNHGQNGYHGNSNNEQNQNHFSTSTKYGGFNGQGDIVTGGPVTKLGNMFSLKVDNLTYDTTREEVKNMFKKYGYNSIGDVHIPKDHANKTSLGFAFVRFYTKREAEDAIESLDGRFLNDRKISIKMARFGRSAPQHLRNGLQLQWTASRERQFAVASSSRENGLQQRMFIMKSHNSDFTNLSRGLYRGRAIMRGSRGFSVNRGFDNNSWQAMNYSERSGQQQQPSYSQARSRSPYRIRRRRLPSTSDLKPATQNRSFDRGDDSKRKSCHSPRSNMILRSRSRSRSRYRSTSRSKSRSRTNSKTSKNSLALSSKLNTSSNLLCRPGNRECSVSKSRPKSRESSPSRSTHSALTDIGIRVDSCKRIAREKDRSSKYPCFGSKTASQVSDKACIAKVRTTQGEAKNSWREKSESKSQSRFPSNESSHLPTVPSKILLHSSILYSLSSPSRSSPRTRRSCSRSRSRSPSPSTSESSRCSAVL